MVLKVGFNWVFLYSELNPLKSVVKWVLVEIWVWLVCALIALILQIGFTVGS